MPRPRSIYMTCFKACILKIIDCYFHHWRMKKLPVIIVCLFYCLCTFGQVPEVMQFTFPKGTEKLNERQFKDFSKHFNKTLITNFHEHVYVKDGLLIHYLNLSTSPKLKRSLEKNQKLMVSMTNGTPGSVVDSSKIITSNNIRFSIIEYHDTNDWYFWFTSDYDRYGNYINGFIEYKKPNEEEARQYLHDFLQSMHFKNN
jgi:hypothetical protein